LAIDTSRYLTISLHLCVEDRELISGIKFHVHGKLAILAPSRSTLSRASLDLVERKGRFEEGASSIDLDIGRPSGASRAEERDAVDLDFLRTAPGENRAWSCGNEADEESKRGGEMHRQEFSE